MSAARVHPESMADSGPGAETQGNAAAGAPISIVSDLAGARALAAASTPFFFTRLAASRDLAPGQGYFLGRKYRGAFDDSDGCYISLNKGAAGETVIDRDGYGSIPLFYSTKRAIVSTELRALVELEATDLDVAATAEYLSTAYLTSGRTIYSSLRILMPDEMLRVDEHSARPVAKTLFPPIHLFDPAEVAALLQGAIERSIADLTQHFPGELLLNLSGGTDSTLLLAMLRKADPNRAITTNTYFHADWRNDLNDWEYARIASDTLGSNHHLIKIDNERFAEAHSKLVKASGHVFHTYAAAFYLQNSVTPVPAGLPIVNGSGPDESMIGTEKMPIADLCALRERPRDEWIDYLISHIDYIKLPEDAVAPFLNRPSEGFVVDRRRLAERLLDAPDFVEFQRRYHALTILQNHILELAVSAQALDAPIVFPYLTNDMFRIVFSASFDALNAGQVYKAALKSLLERIMPHDFVHRTKIGFQSPSRPYFKADAGLGASLKRLLRNGRSQTLDMTTLSPAIEDRLREDIDLHRRYDFLEWSAYNILLLEETRAADG